jgi:hypothetical protein
MGYAGAASGAAADRAEALEALLIQVWDCEREWSLDDRIELATRQVPPARQDT